MESLQLKLRLILQWSIVSVICSTIIGMVFYRGIVFNIHNHAFTFIADAALGALFFFTLRFAGWKHALIVLGLLYVLYMGPLTHAFRYGYTVPFTIFFFVTPLAAFVYFITFHEPGRVKIYWHPFIVGALCAATTILARITLLVIGVQHWYRSWLDFPGSVFPEDWMAFLLGVGMGTGFALTAYRPFRRLLGLPA